MGRRSSAQPDFGSSLQANTRNPCGQNAHVNVRSVTKLGNEGKMVRFFLEQVAALEMALFIGLAVTVVGVTAGVVIWLKRKSGRQDPSGSGF